MNESQINIESIASRRKQQWMKEARKQVTIQQRIANSVPWWLIIIAGGLFALSAGHTAGVFNQLSPVGYAGPFVVEFSLLWAAFARVSAKEEHSVISITLHGLEVLAFVMAVGANAIGAITHVASQAGIGEFSFAKIISQFGTLPIATQAGILFTPLFALFVPIGTWVAGEGLASLILKQRTGGTDLEIQWGKVERVEIYRAIYSVLVDRGTVAVEARRRAESLSAGLTHGQQKLLGSGEPIAQSEPILLPEKPLPVAVRVPVQRTKRPQVAVDVRGQIRTHLAEHEADRKLSARNLSIVVTGSERSRQVANEELQQYRTKEE